MGDRYLEGGSAAGSLAAPAGRGAGELPSALCRPSRPSLRRAGTSLGGRGSLLGGARAYREELWSEMRCFSLLPLATGLWERKSRCAGAVPPRRPQRLGSVPAGSALALLLWGRTTASNSLLHLNQLFLGVRVFFLSVKCRLLFSLC